MNGNFSNIENEAILQGQNSEIYLEDIPLTDKTFNALNNAGFETISDISKLFYSGQLGTIKGIGKKELKELQKIFEHRTDVVKNKNENSFDKMATEWDRRDLFIDWLDENQLVDELPNLVCIIDDLEEYASKFHILRTPIFEEYSPYVFEDLLNVIRDESEPADLFEEPYEEILRFIAYLIEFLYEEDAGVHFKRRKRT